MGRKMSDLEAENNELKRRLLDSEKFKDQVTDNDLVALRLQM